ncbi:MAG TPA: SLBB domain-containing protein [Pyrinomonadaceae bacterium]|nr:SLBB domain-containing protein [Pyrinomonadaceae bacterium]
MKVLTAVLAAAVVCSTVALPASGQEKKKADEAQPPKQSAPAKASEAKESQPATAEAGTPQAQRRVIPEDSVYTDRTDYLLGLGDVLSLKVFGEPQFDTEMVVEDNGNVEVPFADASLPARCRDVKALRKDILALLSEFLKKPRIDLRVTKRESRRPAMVYGAVRGGAQYQLQRRARLLELLSHSGGVSESHNGTIQIWHTEPPMCEQDVPEDAPKKAEVGEDELGLPFEVYRVADLKLGLPEANPYIRNGDIVYVAEASPIYIVGNVVSPNNLHLRQGMTLSRALATVGGVRDDGNQSKIKIYRLNQQTMRQQEIIVDYKAIKSNKIPDFELQPYDIIEVPKKGFSAKNLRDMVIGIGTTSATGLGASLPMRVLY